MRKALSAGAVALACVLASSVAAAQGTVRGHSAPSHGKYVQQPLNLSREATGWSVFAAAARSRMRNGDCAGALDAFDQALISSRDPTLYRDRGLCHEQLGHPYPAIDDYRVYVTDAPDAADAENIRQRLARLEMEVYKHSSESNEGAGGSSGAGGAASGGSAGGSPASSTSDDVPPAARVDVGVDVGDGERRDALETVEHDHDEIDSSLRAGKGVSLAPFFAEHKWLLPGSNFGDGQTWSECVGLQVRWSVGAQSAFLLEAGYETFNATQGAGVSGLTSQLGYELRVPFKPNYRDQFLLGVGIGYEYLTFSPQDASVSGVSGGGFVPRVRIGWRHMLAAAVGLDLSLDGGIATSSLSQGSFLTASGGSQTAEMLGVNVGIAWGL
ncbi:MAG TPA: tetratricopeptide repeat protein [Polyangiaceae bacterium]|jgi:hypothetical protein